MESELWPEVYRLVREEASRRGCWRPRGRSGRGGAEVFSDGVILLVLLWAALHDRPVGWACARKKKKRAKSKPAAVASAEAVGSPGAEAEAEEAWEADRGNWSGCGRGLRPKRLPSQPVASRRLRTVRVLGLLEQVLGRLGDRVPPGLARRVDGKPLPVGGFSKDRDARWGHAVDGKAKGYKLFLAWGAGVVPDAWVAGPMNRAETGAAADDLLPRLKGGGYLLGDGVFDTNPLHAACDALGFQLVAPRKAPGAGLGHCAHEPGRLRSIALLETPAPGDLPGTGPAPFARELYDRRGDIERELGGWCSFGGGLQGLPAWVRTPHRVVQWTAAKLLLNGLRLCRLRGISP